MMIRIDATTDLECVANTVRREKSSRRSGNGSAPALGGNIGAWLNATAVVMALGVLSFGAFVAYDLGMKVVTLCA